MAKNIYGGGSQTNANGLKFEQETDLRDALLKIPGYAVQGNTLYFNGNFIGTIASKHDLYRVLLEPNGVNHKEVISKKLLPDEAIYLESTKTVFIIEKKFQNVAGSVDEKLQTCGFKKRQYSKLFSPLCIRVEYLYIFNDWFSHPQYKDVLDFILENNCYYFFNEIPLNFLGLPHMN
jgi:hypothetical protein